MDNKLQSGQQEYLDSLLSSLSPSAVQSSSKLYDQTKKQQKLIEMGHLQVNEFPKQSSIQLSKHSSKTQSGRQSKSSDPNDDKSPGHEQHLKILRQIIKEKRSRQQRKQSRKRDEQEQLQKQELSIKLRLQQDKQQKQKQKKQRLQQKINAIMLHKQKREEEMKAQNSIIGRLIGESKLYEKFEKKYLLEEAASLEEKKKRLAEIRSLHKPITREDLVEHQRRIDEMREKVPHKQILRSSSVSSNFYKSGFYKKVSVEKKERLLEMEKEKEERFQLAQESKEKVKEYYRYVQDNFKPEVDQNLVKESGNPYHIEIRTPLDIEQVKKKGGEYLKHNIQHRKNKASTEKTGTSSGSSNFQKKKETKVKKSSSEHVLPKTQAIPAIPRVKQMLQDIDVEYMKKQKLKEASRKTSELGLRSRKRRWGEYKQVLNEEDLDALYQKVIKVRESINQS